MQGKIVMLDRHRSPEGRLAAMIRREWLRECRLCEGDGGPAAQPNPLLQAQLTAPPAACWPEMAEKLRFLLGRLALTREGQQPDIQRLTRRSLGDLARLLQQEAAAGRNAPSD